jgi:hypothetical protein
MGTEDNEVRADLEALEDAERSLPSAGGRTSLMEQRESLGALRASCGERCMHLYSALDASRTCLGRTYYAYLAPVPYDRSDHRAKTRQAMPRGAMRS